MSFDTHSNFAVSTVATAPSPANTGTSLTVHSGDGSLFATSQNCTVWPAGTNPTSSNAEIVRITAISTDTFTITRSQESTTARSIQVGDQIANTETAKIFTDIESRTVYWNDVTGTTNTATVNQGYIADNSSLVTITLPATAALGDRIRIVGKGSGGWKIAQNTGQTINFGTSSTTSGTGGSLASVNQYDAVELICITANTTFSVISSQGNITAV